jgi:hypothetical protein
MKTQGSGISAEGRTPPPPGKRYKKGRSGNPAGRPKGSINREGLTRKVALKKHKVLIHGKYRRLTTRDLLIEKLKSMAASGHAGAAAQLNWLSLQIEPSKTEVAQGGFLLVPAPVTDEEFIAEEELRNAGKVEPGTEINIEHEEYIKAVRGEVSPLGEALRSFQKKYVTGRALKQAD